MNDFYKSDGSSPDMEKKTEAVILPVTKISLPNLSVQTPRRDFLPMILVSTVLLFSFFVGNHLGGFFRPSISSLVYSLNQLSQSSLTTVKVVGQKIYQKVSLPKKDSFSLPQSHVEVSPISSPEPSLGQSWRELTASMVVGGSKLQLFGKELWNVVANSTALTVDWLAYGAASQQKEMVGAVDKVKVSVGDSINQALSVASGRVSSSALGTKESFLAMSSLGLGKSINTHANILVEKLNHFDQITTDYLTNITSGVSRKILFFGKNTLVGLNFVSQSIAALPDNIIYGSNELFWQPLAQEANSASAYTLAFVGGNDSGNNTVTDKGLNFISKALNFLIKIGSDSANIIWVVISSLWNHTLGLVLDFTQKTNTGYVYLSDLSGSTSNQMAAVKFMGIEQSTKEFFELISDRLSSFGQWLTNFGKGLWQAAVRNWRSFLGYKTTEDEIKKISTAASINADQLNALEEKIKNQLRNDLRQEMSEVIQKTSSNNISSGGKDGLIVIPSSGNVAEDEKLKAKIQQLFSDQVIVNFDANRKAGVVTPVFNPNDNYIFLLAPVKK